MSLDARQILRTEADTRRPLIHHLTADNSWLLQIPRSGPRMYFNIVIDAWLEGSNLEVSTYFHDQRHTIPPAAQNIGEVDRICGEVEALAWELRSGTENTKSKEVPPESFIDAVVISQQAQDHCHGPTLTPLPSSVPVFAYGDVAVKKVQAWKHFHTIVNIPTFNGNWRSTSLSPLPEGIGIGGVTQLNDSSTLHTGIVVSFQTPFQEKDAGDEAEAEAIVYLPHGIPSEELAIATLASAAPRLKMLAFLHGLLRVQVFPRPLALYANLGAHNALAVQQALNAKYWIPTHDEPKEKYGLTSWILTDFWLTLKEAVANFVEKTGGVDSDVLKQANYHLLENGDGLVLV